MIEYAFLKAILPLIYAIAAVALMFSQDIKRIWMIAKTATHLGLLAAIGTSVIVMLGRIDKVGAEGLGALIGLLIAFLGWAILGYSAQYLTGEPKQKSYVACMLVILSCSSTVVVTLYLPLMFFPWIVMSFALHRLLTFYPSPATLLVAHKKFLVSRCADICLIVALGLIWLNTGSLSLSAITANITHHLPPLLNLAMCLIAVAVIFKSAQLPVHGWLIQVMQAPTPVSALLHAGVVNLGGVVLICLAPLLSHSFLAQAILVGVGSITAVLAGLVSMTQTNIKGRLAWSTSAQMGFMLVECGLGFYDLALLHLIGHSIYKAFAFLNSGNVVNEARLQRELIGHVFQRIPSLMYIAAPFAVLMVVLTVNAIMREILPAMSIQSSELFLSIGLAPYLFGSSIISNRMFKRLMIVVTLVLLYGFLHVVFGHMVGQPPDFSPVLYTFASCAISLLYGVQSWVSARPNGKFVRWLQPLAYEGFFLDGWLTRLALQVWPLPKHMPQQINFR